MTAEEQRAKSRAYREAHPEHMFNWSLKRNYGLTAKEYGEIVARQNNRCAICKKSPPPGKRLFVDHNHQTGVVRGLLCVNCNFLIGHAQESPEVLTLAAKYLHGLENAHQPQNEQEDDNAENNPAESRTSVIPTVVPTPTEGYDYKHDEKNQEQHVNLLKKAREEE